MKAAVLYELNTPLVIEDLTLQEPGTGEVQVRLSASGICHSDWHVVTGDFPRRPMPVVLGHEGAGVIESVGPGVTRVSPGDHVILSWSPECGKCFYCLRGKPALCEIFIGPRRNGTMLDGTTRLKRRGKTVYQFVTIATFGEQTVVPQEACIPIRKDAPLKAASLIGCGVTTGVGAVRNTVGVRAGDSVVVYGCGGIGLNVLQGAARHGAEPIIAVDRVPKKLETAKTFGATHGLVAGDDTLKEILDLTDGRGADYVFEAIGIPEVQEKAFDAVRPTGTLVLVGAAPLESTIKLPSFNITLQEKRIVGSLYGSGTARHDFPLLLDWYMAGKLKLDELISQEYRLEDINKAFEDMLSGEVARGIIVYD